MHLPPSEARSVAASRLPPLITSRPIYLSLDQLAGITSTSSVFLFRASGNSMTGAGIFDGYILVVDKAKRPQPGDVVLAIVGAEFLVKRLQFDCEGRAMLMAENDQYPPLVLADGEELEV